MTTEAADSTVDAVPRMAAPLRQQVIERLRDAISGEQFQPGERLVEKVLCARYGVSRTVIREALRHLEAEGLVDIVANRGPVVRVLSDQEADSLYEVRGALEGLAGQLFAERATPAQREQLLRALDQVRTALADGSLARLLEVKDSFYDALIEGSGNGVIGTALRNIHTQIRMLRSLSLQAEGRLPHTLRELEGIVEATVVRRDPELARIRCLEHVGAAATAMRSAREARRAAEA
ncbi:GntR family transcriptional regulator [Streptomyces sp. NPDC047042]|jgi:DNA-binding GntR family transcriptional regulator|uniref:GntR family transcriptional regulator n=1 Tax=unclassified Streptomyces TaxID=2593676 RepID=UPI00340DD4FB